MKLKNLEGIGRGLFEVLSQNFCLEKMTETQNAVRVYVPFETLVGHLPNTSVERNLYTIHFGVVHIEGVPNYSGELNLTDGRNFSLTSNNTMFMKEGI
jgi:hypothetical protein